MKSTTIDIHPVMEKMKEKRPRYIDGGLRWMDYAYLGQIMEFQYVKFGRGKELLRLLKDISRQA